MIGVINSLTHFAILISSVPGGMIADRINRKQTSLISRFSVALVAVVTAAFVFTDYIQLWHLVIACILLGCALAYGNSSFEALAMGAPIITWPHDFMRGRVTAALYKQMGLNELIATDANAYLTLALRLAQDPDFKHRMQAHINANVYKLYERHEVVREMESFFIAAYEASMNTSPLGEWVEDTIFTDESE